jgi:hypothetical protein
MSDVLALATLIGVFAAVIGVFTAALQLMGLRKQRVRDFEDLFVQRYWKIMDDLSLEAIECAKPDGGPVLPSDRKAVIAFLRLSEDELDLRAKDWIGEDTWKLWRDGMATQLRRWPFDVVWDEVRQRESAAGDDGQFVQLRRAGDRLNEAGFDPKPAGRRLPWQGP